MWEFTTDEWSANKAFYKFCIPFNDTDSRYWNVSSWDYCYCNATFAADPDIAGVGIITTFSSLSLLTLIVAFVAAYYDTVIRQRSRFLSLLQLPIIKENHWPASYDTAAIELGQHPRPWDEPIEIDSEGVVQTIEQKQRLSLVTTLLGNLCDLQLFTGIAIVTSAFAQGDNLTLYHRALVNEYWWLTLNSFWAARQDEIRYGDFYVPEIAQSAPNTIETIDVGWFRKMQTKLTRTQKALWGKERFRTWLRRLAVFACVTEFLVFNFISIRKFHQEQDSFSSGKCFISNDTTPHEVDYLWLTGLILYDFALMVSLLNRTKRILSATSKLLHDGEDLLFKSLSIVTLCYTAIVQFASVWAFGSGFYLVEVLFYAGFWAWSFYDIVDMKLSNRYLIIGSENSWGFGQVYAVAAMGIFIFNFTDAVNHMKSK
ncbi:hypothetical protein BU23DRAFT_566918 [Bimuria novae-zelandiae CBS 107.79]|uniref:Uncharacterized protein n=1 Tax=Bimuria novae-zelandiae CBS 107.79 TaxID=1447943 RepID=A0A6A5VEZ7_9PLEO|nr:hypothetical protein BU23DRAFT_566918 [Bimuria novae-zelandiae CBS 107.79]